MKRIAVWLAIILAPTLIWFAFTADGNAALRLMFSRKAHTENAAALDVGDFVSPGRRLSAHHLVFIPARPVPTQPALRVRLSGTPTIGVFVFSPRGTRSGIEPKSAAEVMQIPNSSVRRRLTRTGAGRMGEVVTITIRPALSSIYTLAISAKRSGDYRLAVGGVSPALNAITDVLNGRVPEDTSVRYRIDLRNIKPLPVAGVPGLVAKSVPSARAFVSDPEETVIEPSSPVLVAAAAAITKDPCGYFFQKLETVPHEKLVRTHGRIRSVWDGEAYSGCQVVAVATGNVPNFAATEGTYLYHLGWRMNNTVAADGPWSSMFGIENGSVRCLVSSEQQTTVDKATRKLIAGNAVTLTVQCRWM